MKHTRLLYFGDRICLRYYILLVIFTLLGVLTGCLAASVLSRLPAAVWPSLPLYRGLSDRSVFHAAMLAFLFPLALFLSAYAFGRGLTALLFLFKGFLLAVLFFTSCRYGGIQGIGRSFALVCFHGLFPLPLHFYTAASLVHRSRQDCRCCSCGHLFLMNMIVSIIVFFIEVVFVSHYPC